MSRLWERLARLSFAVSLELETREIRNEKTIIFFAVTDFTDTIMVKMFAKNEIVPEITAHVKKGAFTENKRCGHD